MAFEFELHSLRLLRHIWFELGGLAVASDPKLSRVVSRSLSSPNKMERSSQNLSDYLDDLGIRDLLNESVPVDIERIARILGAESVQHAKIQAAGILIPNDESFSIFVNKNESRVRRRFSCAHEIAHAILDTNLNPSMRNYSGAARNSLERRCDDLAALLLMPDPTFSNYANVQTFSIQSIMKLANVFQTSIQATAIRLIDVIDEPSLAIVSEMADRRTGYRLRVRWGYQNIRRLRKASSYFLPKGKSINLATAEMAYKTSQIQSGNEDLDIGNLRRSAYTEAKAFGSGKSRYVLSLVFPER